MKAAHLAFQKTAVSRADLVRLAGTFPLASVKAVAKELGFVHVREPDPQIATERFDFDELGLSAAETHTALAQQENREPQEAATSPASVDIRFWRLETMEFREEAPVEVVEEAKQEGLTESDWTSPGQSLFATPRPTPLAPWSRLWPLLRQALQSATPSREPDVPAYVHSVARGDVVVEIPRAKRKVWSSQFSVWIDRSARLGPFWWDQEELRRRLRRLGDRRTIPIRWLDASTQARSIMRRGDLLAGYRADARVPILVLGDLGALGTEQDRAVWRHTGRRLQKDEIRLSALVPCSTGRWSADMATLWGAMAWERGRHRNAGDAWRTRAERLLTMLSPVAHAEPGLLRAIRLLMPPWEADASTEADVWNHEDVLAADATGWVLKSKAAEKWRAAFARNVDPATQERVRGLIRAWHESLPREVLRAETLTWFGLDSPVEPPGDLQDALDFVRRLEASVSVEGEGEWLAAATTRFSRQLLEGVPPRVYEKVPALKKVWVASFEGEPVPEGVVMDIEALGPPEAKRHWSLRQVGRDLEFSLNERGTEWPSYVEGPGSPVAWLEATRPWVMIVRGSQAIPMRLEEGLSLAFELDAPIELRTDCCTVRLAPWCIRDEPGCWSAAGRDRFGLWADAEICGVLQRFRWIPPGRFLMGSPENEAGRYDNEGPQHWVTWTQGRWLADTPVTQGLWKAVKGENPSRFQSVNQSTDDRPVERVSWEECTAFAEAIGMRLPTEAEWEHACRAGTTTATWAGDLRILGDNNAPMLDRIAWYGGNSGVAYDLDEGYGATGWPGKQHAFDKAGTRGVGRKDPNPFGLYDLLGNVYEWCRDASAEYTEKAAVDPEPVEKMGARRVRRGGSWFGYARLVRAASRVAFAPGYRDVYLGFRLARAKPPR